MTKKDTNPRLAMYEKIKYRKKVLQMLAMFAEGVRRYFFLLFLLCVIDLLLAMMAPVFYSMFISDVIISGKAAILGIVIAGYLANYLLTCLTAFVENRCRYMMKNTVFVRLKKKLINGLLSKDFSEYDRMDIGRTKMLLDEDIEHLSDFVDAQSINYIIQYVKMVILLIVLFLMDWRLSLILVAMVPISFLLQHWNGKRAQKWEDLIWDNYHTWASWMNENLYSWREVRTLNQQENSRNTFIDYIEKYRKYFRMQTHYWVTAVLVIPKIKDEFLMQFLLYFLGGIFIYKGYLSIGVLLVFAEYYKMLTDSVKQITDAEGSLQTNRSYYDRVLNKAFRTERKTDDAEKLIETLPSYDIELQNVSFQYDEGEQEILHDFQLQIKEGERIGIVGESGRGKSTLLKLLTGMAAPTSGNILVGGVNLQQIDLDAFYTKIGFVQQENKLFNDTIYENLLYGNETADRNDMMEACKKACIDKFILTLPDGLDTVIGENGIKLSGGQKQRLVLARLFLKNAEIYIFDEATSALDQRHENLVQKNLRKIGRNKTIIVVSHRKSSLQICDRLIDPFSHK